jgi:hypothetical protein
MVLSSASCSKKHSTHSSDVNPATSRSLRLGVFLDDDIIQLFVEKPFLKVCKLVLQLNISTVVVTIVFMNIKEVLNIGKQSSTILYEILAIVKSLIADHGNNTWRMSYVRVQLKHFHHQLKMIIAFGKKDHPRNVSKA